MRSPQSLRIYRVSSPFFLLLCCFLRCAAHDGPAPFLFAAPPGGPVPYLDFAWIELTGAGSFPALPASIAGDSLPPGLSRRPAVLRLEDGRFCLSAVPIFYAREEQGAGLRFLHCGEAWRNPELQSVLTVLTESPDPAATAYPTYVGPGVSIFIARPAELRARIGTVLASVDGAPSAQLPGWKLAGRDLRYSYSGSGEPAAPPALPRRFPLSYFHLLLTQEHAYLAYEFESSGDRLLVIALHDAGLSTTLLAALQRLRGVQHDVLQRAGRDGVHPAEDYVSELYFRDQGPADEYIEFAGDNESRLIEIRFAADGKPYAGRSEIFLFPHAAYLLTHKDHKLNLKRELTFPNGRSLRLADMQPASGLRAFVREAGMDPQPLGPALQCYGGAGPCGSAGLAPTFARSASAQTGGAGACSTEDVSLSELNFSGVFEPQSGRIQAGGRFVEVELRSDCRPDSLALIAGNAVVEFGRQPARRVLFTADGEYFADLPGQARLVLHSKLRHLTADDTILVHDWRSGRQRILRYGEDVAHWTGTARTDSAPLRAVHSLEFAGTPAPDYTGPRAIGLRPDLLADNAMTPGHAGVSETTSEDLPTFAEILPQGGRNADGVSLPDEEFIEFRNALTSGKHNLTMLELEVVRERDGDRRRYRFPAMPGVARFTIADGEPECFAAGPGLRLNDLHLPNEAAVYRLRNNTGTLVDELRIDASTYARLDGDPRTSLSRCFGCATDGEPVWRPTDGEAARSDLCAGRTYASPGRPESFRPFLSTEALTSSTRRFTLHSDVDRELHFLAGNDLNTPALRAQAPDRISVRLSPGQSFEFTPSFTGNRFRAIYAVSDNGDAILAFGEAHPPGRHVLAVHAVSPTPGPGAYEWFRVCSPDGFALEPGTSLHIRDGGGFEDELISYAERFPQRNLPPAFRHSTETDLTIPPGRCAVIVDPDDELTDAGRIPLLADDVRLWTVRSSSTIGNGLSSAESILLFLRRGTQHEHLATYGLPDGPESFGLGSSGGYYVRRIDVMHDNDRPESYVVDRLPEVAP